MEIKYVIRAGKHRGLLKDYDMYPRAEDRKSYEELPEEVKRQLMEEGEKYLNFDYPLLTASGYMRYYRIGNRKIYENDYFKRRNALLALVLAECVEYKGRFIDDIINGIMLICEESGWQLPAHNLTEDFRHLPLPDNSRPVIDLFAAETGALLAWTGYLLEARLRETSELICERIYRELNTRIFTPYLEEHFFWMGRGDSMVNNWTPWCTQNVLAAAFLAPVSQKQRSRIFNKAAVSCDYFMNSYGEDGYCNEGAHYYRAAGLCQFGITDIMNYVSGGEFEDLFTDSKMKNIALYLFRVHAAGEYYFNFADGSAAMERCGIREFLFGKATGQKELCRFAAEDFRDKGRCLYFHNGEQVNSNMYYMLQVCFHFREITDYDCSGELIYPDTFFESGDLLITRNNVFALAVKGGNNNDSHNHNDVGSFTLYKNGHPLFIDIGVESYSAKTFSRERYSIWTMKSSYHNLPVLEGTDQNAGAEYHASDVAYFSGDDKSGISMEIAGAYPLTGVTYYRTVELDKQNSVVSLRDETNCRNAVMNLMTYEKPVWNGGRLNIGDAAAAEVEGAELIDIESFPITDARLLNSWKHEIYRIRLQLTGSRFTLNIR